MTTNSNVLALTRLQHNIKVPAIEDVWLEGYEGFQGDLDEHNNPYQHGSAEYKHWQDGWWASFYGEEPLFDLAGGLNQRAALDTATHAANDADMVKKESHGRRLFEIGCVVFVAALAYQAIDMAT